MHILISLFVTIIWGFNTVVVKIGITEIPVFAYLAIRFIAITILFLPFAKFNKDQMINLFKVGFYFNTMHLATLFGALYFITASSAVIVQQTQAPMAMIFAYFILKEQISLRQFVGIMIAIGGIIFIYGAPEFSIMGVLITFLSSIFFGYSQIIMKRIKDVDLVSYIAYTSLFSIPFLIMSSFIFGEKIDFGNMKNFTFIWTFLYQVIALTASLMLWQYALSKYGINKIAPVILLRVIFTIFAGAVLLSEKIDLYIVAGTLVTIVGVALTTIKFGESK